MIVSDASGWGILTVQPFKTPPRGKFRSRGEKELGGKIKERAKKIHSRVHAEERHKYRRGDSKVKAGKKQAQQKGMCLVQRVERRKEDGELVFFYLRH